MTMQRDRHGRKNDEHPESKGGETKLLRRGKQGHGNFFDCVGRGEHAAWRFFYLSRRNADEVSWNRFSAEK